jgi:hypothetical protein
MPTIRIFESAKVVVISVSRGVLTRPVRLKIYGAECVEQGHYVDTMCVHHSDTMKYFGVELPRHDENCDQMASSLTMVIPFFRFVMESRIGLGVGMLKQALCTMATKGDATMVSLGNTDPLVMTELVHALVSKPSTESPVVIPGLNTVLAFINMQQNTEDVCVVSKEFSESSSFAWIGTVDYSLPKDCGKISPGDVVDD